VKQIIQNHKTGELRVAEVPAPALKSGGVLVRNYFSAISAGTERTTVNLGQKGLIGKAKARPDLVKKVMDTARKEGLRTTFEKAKARMERPKALGYSSAGVVIEVSADVDGLSPGDRVACAGQDYASHAEVVFVPENLCAKILGGVKLEYAAFTTLGAVALQGIRQAQLTLGEKVAVIGLGLIGQLTVQLAKAAGCEVLGVDLNERNVEFARESGADVVAIHRQDDVEALADKLSNGYGMDAVLITAAAKSNDPILLASDVLRDRGRVIVVGAVVMDVPREPFYEKELELKLSRSYGPGRYDRNYEEKGLDYPIGYVRWTEKRNMEEFLRLLNTGKVDVDRLITHRFPIDDAVNAYDLILGKTKEWYLGILLEYPEREVERENRVYVEVGERVYAKKDAVRIGVIGAGNFAQAVLLPDLKRNPNVVLKGVATATGINARSVAERFGFEYATSHYEEILSDRDIDAVVIATRHNLHAQAAIEALKQGRAVFVEKPLALNEAQLKQITETHRQLGISVGSQSSPPRLMVGFNRRFAPLVNQVKNALGQRISPYVVNYRVNAGFVSKAHWTQDAEEGGGRIIGEVCHFVDTIQYIVDSKPIKVFAEIMSTNSDKMTAQDNVSIMLKFEDGSVGTIVYTALGDSSFPKERIEAFGNNSVAVIDDFRKGFFFKKGQKTKFKGNGKGHREELEAFVAALQNGSKMPISFEEMVLATLVTYKVLESVATGSPALINLHGL